jgi:iron complex outermembrane receptor protein
MRSVQLRAARRLLGMSTFAASVALSLAGLRPDPASAQAAAADAAPLEEIVVTARRREEALQDVPVAVSAFGAADLQALQAENLDALQGAVPNMNLVQGRGSATSANIFIRGIGQPDALQTFDPGVGVYIDDVYLSRIQGALLSLYDVERIEVLRGPQGTLYGKNTIAGAMKIVTRRPTAETRLDVELAAGEAGRRDAKVYLSGGLTDTLSASISGLVQQRDGLVRDVLTGREYNDRDNTAARAALRWQPSDSVDVQFALDWTEQENALNLGRNEAPLVAVNLLAPTTPIVLAPARAGEFDFTAASTLPNSPGQKLRHWGPSLTVAWDASDAVSLKSITAWRSLETASYIDIDATQFQLGDVFVGLDQEQLSQELQLQYDAGGRFSGIVGLYYLRENVASSQRAFADDFLRLGPTARISFLRTIDDDLTTESYALFGQGSYALTDALSATLGLRFTTEDKDYFRTTTVFSSFAPLRGTFVFQPDDSWDAFTPSVTLDYALDDDVLLYASAARGFKSGGFNGRSNSAAEASTFEPEFVWTYEVGAKSTLADGRLRLNAAAFYSDYTNFQARVSEVVNPNAPVPTFGFPVLNAGQLEITGAELEATWVPVDALSLSAQLGYLQADYKEFDETINFGGRPTVRDRSGDQPPFAPEWTARFAANYTFALGNAGSLTLGADTQYRSKAWLSVDNRDVLTQEAFWLSNVYAAWASADEHWRVSAAVKNVADEVYKTDAQEFSSVGNIQTAYYGDPRLWSFSVGYRF